MKSRIICSLCLLTTLAFFGGCAVGPNYKRPTVDSPANFRFATSETTNCFGDLPWWQVFKEPALQDLIGTALTNNYDLKRAVARVEQARQQAVAARAPLYPQLGYNGSVGRGRNAAFNSAAVGARSGRISATMRCIRL